MDTEHSTLIVKLVKGEMMDGTSHEDRPPAPALRCRCCGGELDSFYQVGSIKRPGTWQVTCWNEGCTLANFTLAASTYLTRDLTDYGFTQPDQLTA